jgi:anti-anti-sigma factor
MLRWRRPRARFEEASLAARGLTIHSMRDGRAHVIRPVGELDRHTADDFEHELKRVEATDVREILVDLSRLESIDSVGLKVLILASARSRMSGGRLLLARGPDRVHRRFQTTGMESRLPFADINVTPFENRSPLP